jgi:hypothetical protein
LIEIQIAFIWRRPHVFVELLQFTYIVNYVKNLQRKRGLKIEIPGGRAIRYTVTAVEPRYSVVHLTYEACIRDIPQSIRPGDEICVRDYG